MCSYNSTTSMATLRFQRDDDEEDNIDVALNVIVKTIKAEVVAIEYEKNTYTRNISMSIGAESVSGTIQLLLQKLSPSLGAESLKAMDHHNHSSHTSHDAVCAC